jgi:hypothetical protein
MRSSLPKYHGIASEVVQPFHMLCDWLLDSVTLTQQEPSQCSKLAANVTCPKVIIIGSVSSHPATSRMNAIAAATLAFGSSFEP